jgi:hypothetical protein
MHEDMSDLAVRARYDKANISAIVNVDKKVFDSLQDVLSLLKERKELLTEIERLRYIIEEVKSGKSS